MKSGLENGGFERFCGGVQLAIEFFFLVIVVVVGENSNLVGEHFSFSSWHFHWNEMDKQ